MCPQKLSGEDPGALVRFPAHDPIMEGIAACPDLSNVSPFTSPKWGENRSSKLMIVMARCTFQHIPTIQIYSDLLKCSSDVPTGVLGEPPTQPDPLSQLGARRNVHAWMPKCVADLVTVCAIDTAQRPEEDGPSGMAQGGCSPPGQENDMIPTSTNHLFAMLYSPKFVV